MMCSWFLKNKRVAAVGWQLSVVGWQLAAYSGFRFQLLVFQLLPSAFILHPSKDLALDCWVQPKGPEAATQRREGCSRVASAVAKHRSMSEGSCFPQGFRLLPSPSVTDWGMAHPCRASRESQPVARRGRVFVGLGEGFRKAGIRRPCGSPPGSSRFGPCFRPWRPHGTHRSCPAPGCAPWCSACRRSAPASRRAAGLR